MKLEQMSADDLQDPPSIPDKIILMMIMQRLERIENKIDRTIDEAINERLGLKKNEL